MQCRYSSQNFAALADNHLILYVMYMQVQWSQCTNIVDLKTYIYAYIYVYIYIAFYSFFIIVHY